ncbi:MAG: anti-sigma factor [Saprospiraceae bacterium]|nr:anti-sigma factor [Saprospiraceae bacterium]
MDKQQFLASGLLEQYVLGLTDQKESVEVEKWLRKHPDLQKEVDAMHEALEQYSLAQGIKPPSGLRSKIMRDIEANGTDQLLQVEPQTAPPAPGRRWTSYIWPVAASIALLFTLIRNNGLGHDLRSAKAELAQTQYDCEEEARRFQAFLGHSATKTVTLPGVAEGSSVAVVVYWNPEQKLAFVDMSTLPTPPNPQKQFQIWADVEGEMINLGLLRRGEPDTLQPIAFLRNAESLNITLEPLGGSPHPHVQDLLASKSI